MLMEKGIFLMVRSAYEPYKLESSYQLKKRSLFCSTEVIIFVYTWSQIDEFYMQKVQQIVNKLNKHLAHTTQSTRI
jgi:hypothetical protein